MAKVIKVDNIKVLVGMDDGSTRELRREDVDFEIAVGDKVEVYGSGDEVVILKAEEKKEEKKQTEGININIQNSNTVGSGAIVTDYEAGSRVVNKITYILLALFLGGLGAHKFYAKKTGAGIVYILFCWTYIPSFIAFIEMIIAITKKSDSNGNIVV